MLEIVKKRISLTKGDDASVWLRPRYKDKSIYTVQEGDRAYFRIKTTTDTLELECNVNVDANKIVVSFVPDDTKDMLPGIYRYEAELVTSWGMHYTFLADQTFILGKELEKHVSNASANSGNYGNNIPSIDGELEEEPVIDGDIQPTNPSLDYETLNHLPKINHNTLRGDMSNEDLGIPTKTSDLDNDSDFVSDNAYVHTDNNYDDESKALVDTLGTAAFYDAPESGDASEEEVVLGSDSRLSDARTPLSHTHTKSEITDFPNLGTASAYNVPVSGNAGQTEVVKGDDTRLSDARTPVSHTHTLSEITDSGTAAAKNFTTSVSAESTDLVTSGAVKTAIDNAVASSYHHAGTKTVAELTSALLIAENQGNVYNITDSGTTTADFIEGAGHPIDVGANVGVAKVGNAFKFDLLSGFVDTSNFVEKSSTSGLLKNDGSVDTKQYVEQVQGKGLSTNDYDNTAKSIVDGVTSALADKVDKVQGKGLSTNDYDNTAKGIVDGVTSALADKVDKVDGKGLSTNDYDATEKNKVSTAYTHSQTTNGNPHNVTASDVGLGNVDNTSDANKPVSTATQTALNNKVDKVNGKGLSTEDYTTAEKTKLGGISDNANKVESSATNGYIKIDGAETKVYDDSLFKALGLSVVNGAVCQTYNI